MHSRQYFSSNKKLMLEPFRCADPQIASPVPRSFLSSEACAADRIHRRRCDPALLHPRTSSRIYFRPAALKKTDSDRPVGSEPLDQSASGLEGEEKQPLTNSDSPEATAADSISLLCVSLLWSTYSPALRYLFSLPGPPTPAALTTVRAVLQAACLLPVVILQGAIFSQ